MAKAVGFQFTEASQQTISEYSRRELQEAFSKCDPEGTGATSIKNLKVNFFYGCCVWAMDFLKRGVILLVMEVF